MNLVFRIEWTQNRQCIILPFICYHYVHYFNAFEIIGVWTSFVKFCRYSNNRQCRHDVLHPSINTYCVTRHLELLSGGISMKLAKIFIR